MVLSDPFSGSRARSLSEWSYLTHLQSTYNAVDNIKTASWQIFLGLVVIILTGFVLLRLHYNYTWMLSTL